MFIYVDIDELETLAKLCAQLVREQVTFEVRPNGHRWQIEFTGGF